MNSKEKRRLKLEWIIPITAFSLILLGILANFTFTGKRVSQEKVDKKIEAQLESYGAQLYAELEAMTMTASPVINFLKQDKYADNIQIMRDLEQSLYDASRAYMVLISDTDGNVTLRDGGKRDISAEPYFNAEITEQHYFYVREECIKNKSAIISAIPVFRQDGETLQRIIYMYYPADRFSKLFKTTFYEEDTFYMLTLEDGSIVQNGGYNKEFIKGDNLFEVVFEPYSTERRVQRAYNQVKSGRTGFIAVKNADQEKNLYYTPLRINNWYLFMGVNKSSIDQLAHVDWSDMGKAVKWLTVAIATFLLYILLLFMKNKTKYKEDSKKLEEKAETDLLMELYNKITTEREIKNYIAENPKAEALFFLIDIDNFKKINDTRGHAFGDEVLRAIGTRLRVEFRKTDILGRVGGDEIVIFLKDIPNHETAERESQRVSEIFQHFNVGEYVKYTVTASIGACVYSKDGFDFETLYKAADKALYVSKNSGKNCMTYYTKS